MPSMRINNGFVRIDVYLPESPVVAKLCVSHIVTDSFDIPTSEVSSQQMQFLSFDIRTRRKTFVKRSSKSQSLVPELHLHSPSLSVAGYYAIAGCKMVSATTKCIQCAGDDADNGELQLKSFRWCCWLAKIDWATEKLVSKMKEKKISKSTQSQQRHTHKCHSPAQSQ